MVRLCGFSAFSNGPNVFKDKYLLANFDHV